MYIKIEEPIYSLNYRIMQTLRFKGNNVDLTTCKQEILNAVNYFNKVVQTDAHKNPKQIFAVDIFQNCIAIFLSTNKAQEEPAKGLQLFSTYFTDHDTLIGQSARNNKLFVKADDPVKLEKIVTDYDVVKILANVLLNPANTGKYSYEALRREEVISQVSNILFEGLAV
ncbi:hypothetical protein DIC82_03105 [Clostridium beijerinckii]|nr:hypothetical protein DIC82_03105 [Clostridium beijerinckii]